MCDAPKIAVIGKCLCAVLSSVRIDWNASMQLKCCDLDRVLPLRTDVHNDPQHFDDLNVNLAVEMHQD